MNEPRLVRVLVVSVIAFFSLLVRLRRANENWLKSQTPDVAAAGSFANANDEGRFEYTHANDTAFVVFYNLFVLPPTDEEGVTRAGNVLNDQLKQIADALSRIGKGDGIVYYNLVGNGISHPPEKIEQLCRALHGRLRCELINHHPNASESAILLALYEYCHDDVESREDSRVTYLHSKGSYHNNKYQGPWRREMTKSSLHEDCLHPPDDRCDVCGAQFYTRHALMFPGNMWTARCSYVRRLLPPVEGGEYERRKEGSVGQFHRLRSMGILQNSFTKDAPDYYGRGRYTWEHWVASHPSIEPCDVHGPDVNFKTMLEDGVKAGDYQWAMGPRRAWAALIPTHAETIDRENSREDQFREYLLLSGNILKWVSLYGEVPRRDSWVWDYFPAGSMWKKLVDRYGVDAMVEVRSIHEKCQKLQPAADSFALGRKITRLLSSEEYAPMLSLLPTFQG